MGDRRGIRAEGIVKAYDKREVVCGVDFEINPGEIVGLLGPNGAGKSTSFYMIVGLVSVTRGRVWLDGEDVTDVPMYKRSRKGIGYLPQEPSIFRNLTVKENIQAIAETLKIGRQERKAVIEEHLEELGLGRLADQKAYTLSGGERRRLEISRALVTSPKYILMDEPFSGVDPISVKDVQDIILKLRKRGIGILITDHNVRETLKIVDRAYLLHGGKVIAKGSGEDLVNDPSSRELYLGQDFHM